MLDSQKISSFIALKRKEMRLTQAEIAEKLKVSYQAVSRWENGTIPNVEILVELARLLNVSVDTLLNGGDRVTYEQANVDLAYLAALRKGIAAHLTVDSRITNKPAAQTMFYDIQFPDMESPVLVTSSGWYGAKCELAARYGYNELAGNDIVNDLVSNIIAAGAKPLVITDYIAVEEADENVILSIMEGVSYACKENHCSLIGGSTCFSPYTLHKGTYMISANAMGIVPRKQLLDGSAICDGDVILAVASNGLHTNGYTLIHVLMEKMPLIKKEIVAGETFLEQIMKPHVSYYEALSPMMGREDIHGIVHHSWGRSHLRRLLSDGLCAEINLNQVRPLPIFSYIKRAGNITEHEMLSSFNCGMGMWLVVAKESAGEIISLVGKHFDCYEVGKIKAGSSGAEKVVYRGQMDWYN